MKPGVRIMAWALVELMRDREGMPRLSAREGCRRLVKDYLRHAKGGHSLTPETVRRWHKSVEKAMRRSLEQRAIAASLLESARQQRELRGWDMSPWFLLIPPAVWQAQGYEITIKPNDIVVATRRSPDEENDT
jgi:hypothetical protein